MSKVICDVCGTTYPETASACPICGCAKNTTEQTAADSSQAAESAAYAPVKGGRFSKSNVRKRNKKVRESRRSSGDEEPQDDGAVNKGLVAVVLILLLAIVAVLGYIGVRFLLPEDSTEPSDTGTTQGTEDPAASDSTSPSGDSDKACTDIKLSATTVELTEEGMVWMLSTELTPKDTDEEVTFASADPQVATVDENGKITAVGGGETVITVTCGEITAACNVKCSFGSAPTTETTEPQVSIPVGFVLTLKYTDITISEKYPDPVALFRDTDEVKAADITWSVDDPEVAAISENGVVSPVGKGYTTVRATFGDQTASCKIIVSFEPSTQPQAKYTISHRDVTLEIGGSDRFTLNLTDEQGANVQNVQWTASEEGYVEIDGKNIKAIQSTQEVQGRYIVVSATVEEYTYSCIVRITEKETDEE